jgi:hypothetical protein
MIDLWSVYSLLGLCELNVIDKSVRLTRFCHHLLLVRSCCMLEANRRNPQ